MKKSFEVVKNWLLPDLPEYSEEHFVKLYVDVEPLNTEFVSRYRNRVTWKAAVRVLDLNFLERKWQWLFCSSKTFMTNANTEEDIVMKIKKELGVL